MTRCLFTSVLLLAGLSIPTSAQAGTVLNFDSLPAAGLPGGLSGKPVTDYFASYGITVTGTTPTTPLAVYDTRTQGGIPIATSPFNILAQQNPTGGVVSYTLDFSLPQDQFSMTRIAIHSGSTGEAFPEWQAFAFDGAGHLLSSVGENAFSTFSDVPAEIFTLNGPSIRSVTISSDNGHFAAFGSVLLDNFVVSAVPGSAVPEPHSLVLASIGCLAFVGNHLRKRWNSRAPARSVDS